MIQKVSQSYPNARGVKKGLISTRGVSVEVIFDGKGASVWKKGVPMNKFKKWWWCLSTFFSPKCLASSTVQLPDWKPPTQHTFIMQPKTVRREKQSSHHVDKKNLQQSVINWCSSSKATTLDSSWPKKHKRTTRANMTVVEKSIKWYVFELYPAILSQPPINAFTN